MKNYKLRTVDFDGKVIEESDLKLKEGSILIQHMPEKVTYETAANCHRVMVKGLEDGSGVITTIHGVVLQVLEIQ